MQPRKRQLNSSDYIDVSWPTESKLEHKNVLSKSLSRDPEATMAASSDVRGVTYGKVHKKHMLKRDSSASRAVLEYGAPVTIVGYSASTPSSSPLVGRAAKAPAGVKTAPNIQKAIEKKVTGSSSEPIHVTRLQRKRGLHANVGISLADKIAATKKATAERAASQPKPAEPAPKAPRPESGFNPFRKKN